MRKFYMVRNCGTGSLELVLADGHVDALSFYRKRHKINDEVLECADVFVSFCDERYFTTKLKELPDGYVFYRCLPGQGWCVKTPIRKLKTYANGMVKCKYLTEPDNRPCSYFKGSTPVAIVDQKEYECSK